MEESQLEKIISILGRIEKILERMEQKLVLKREEIDFDPFILLELPDNLRSTLTALLKLKEATASDVAAITRRGRAIESHYLNTLVKMGYADKKREGRKVYYRVKGF